MDVQKLILKILFGCRLVMLTYIFKGIFEIDLD